MTAMMPAHMESALFGRTTAVTDSELLGCFLLIDLIRGALDALTQSAESRRDRLEIFR
jgi:hypothetical protein